MLPALGDIPGHLPSTKVVAVFASLSLFSLVSQVQANMYHNILNFFCGWGLESWCSSPQGG